MRLIATLICIILLSGHAAYSSIIEELDNPPEGAHAGQMLLNIFITIGYPIGNAVDSEKNFLTGSTYTFTDNGTIKKMYIDHISFSYGLMFEYMPIDYLGAYVRLRRSEVVQRTVFGTEYNNTNRILYSDFSLIIGPSLHFTNRRWWDISLTPLVGYSFGKFKATPVAQSLFRNMNLPYTSGSEKDANGLVIGTELRFSAYFAGGFFMSVGFDWTLNMPSISGSYNLTNPQQPSVRYSLGGSLELHTMSFILMTGYAFSN